MVNETFVRKVGRLAGIKLTDEELHHLSGELTRILSFMNQLEEVKTKGLKPLTTPIQDDVLLRADKVEKDATVDEVLANAPHAQDDFFLIPQVIKD